MNTIGHVAYERRGHDLYLRCNNCGSNETVVDYENGGRPRFFGWPSIKADDQEFAKCLRCLMVRDRGGARAINDRVKRSRLPRQKSIDVGALCANSGKKLFGVDVARQPAEAAGYRLAQYSGRDFKWTRPADDRTSPPSPFRRRR